MSHREQMTPDTPTPEQWLSAEDNGCHQPRAARLAWLLEATPRNEIWVFPGGWLGQQLFEEARYCFIYGQFIASAILGFAFVERTLAAMFYGAGRNDLERATSERLFKEAVAVGWLNDHELQVFENARRLRNPLVHFRPPLHKELPETRSAHSDRHPNEVVEGDAKLILEVVFRLVARNAAN